jgi:hypothetical protein
MNAADCEVGKGGDLIAAALCQRNEDGQDLLPPEPQVHRYKLRSIDSHDPPSQPNSLRHL